MRNLPIVMLPPEIGALANDPDQHSELLGALDLARRSYSQILNDGVDRSDIELARDQHYRLLLWAGQKIQRLGGPLAVSAASQYLGGSAENAAERHFFRLWHGLLPERDS